MDADGFERSLYLSQRFPFIGPDNNTIRSRLGSLLDSSEDLGAFENADALLDDVRRYYMVNGGRGHIRDLTDMATEKEAELTRSRDAAETAARLCEKEKCLAEEKEALQKESDILREKRRVAERRQLLEEQKATYARLYEAMESEKRALTPLEDFFATHFPSEKEIKATDFLLSEKAGALARLESCHLNDEEEKVRAAGEARFGNAATAENLFLLKEANNAWLAAREKAKVQYPFDISEFNALDSRFKGSIPTQEALDTISEAATAFEDANANLYMAESEKKKSIHPSLLIPAALAALFLVLAIVGFALSAFPLALITIGLFLLSSAAFIWFFLHAPKEKDTLATLAAEKRNALAAMLLPYGYTDKNPSVSASLFFTHIARYRALLHDKAVIDEAYLGFATDEEAKRAALGI